MLITPAPTFKEVFTSYSLGEMAGDETPEKIQVALRKLASGVKTSHYDGFANYQSHHTWERNASITQSAYLEAI
jgi:hypothetical protein